MQLVNFMFGTIGLGLTICGGILLAVKLIRFNVQPESKYSFSREGIILTIGILLLKYFS